jgi:hypothetical protein
MRAMHSSASPGLNARNPARTSSTFAADDVISEVMVWSLHDRSPSGDPAGLSARRDCLIRSTARRIAAAWAAVKSA